LQDPPETPDSALRLVTRHRISIFNVLPVAHKAQITKVDGVEAIVGSMWFGGYYLDQSNFFANFSVDADDFFRVNPDFLTPAEQQQAFIADQTGALVGDKLMDRFGWKVGDRITLIGTLFPMSPELTIRAVYREGNDNGNSLYFHWKYFDEGIKGQFGANTSFVGTYQLRAASPEDVTRVAGAVDELFANSSWPTKTETERAFQLGFVEMLGDVQLFLTSIISVVVFTVLLVAANSMAMSIRERTREIGVLKALGFRRRHVLGLLIGESLLLAMSGTVIGAFLARYTFSSVDMGAITMGFIQRFDVRPETLLLCLGIGLFVGIFAAGVPAWQAAGRPVVEALGKR
jgi:putative ABC transport system permease protein